MPSLDNDGVDRQTYEKPNCGRTTPHEQHFHSPIGGLTLNCPGVAEPETIVNYVVMVRVPGKVWLNMDNVPEKYARKAYDTWLHGRGHLEVKLVKRTAVITDEVIEQGVQGQPWADPGYPHVVRDIQETAGQ